MALYAGSFEWPASIAYEIAGVPGPVGTGTVEIVGDRYLLRPSEGFAFSSLESSERTLKTEIDGVPSLLVGHVFVFDGVAGLRIDEARIGTDDPNETFTGVAATFELLESLCTWRYEDGAARPASVPLRLPEIAATPAMSLGLDATGLAVIRAVTATSLDAFDQHLSALQDLVCVAADNAAERLSLTATTTTGNDVTILGRNRFPPFGRTPRQPVEYLMRFGATYAQDIISGWWKARTSLRPVTQVLAGLRYQPGWIETDVNILAASIELFGQVQFPSAVSRRISVLDFARIETALDSLSGLTRPQREFINFIKSSAGGRPQKLDESIDAVITDLGESIQEAGIHPSAWKPALLEARNGVSHAGGAVGLTDSELRAVRDATRVVLTLDLLHQVGLPDSALARACERLKVRYSIGHRETPIYAPF